MNSLLQGLKENDNKTLTENGGKSYKSTMNNLMDLFALSGAYRTRSEEDCIVLFAKAFKEDPVYALKCLFYLRDVRGGQGERRFFRVICRWLAIYETEAMERNLQYVPEFGRWDDLYTFVDTPLEAAAFKIIYDQFTLDLLSKTPSLLGKWLKSENASSKETKTLAKKTRQYLGLTAREYRKSLSTLRERIKVVERLMSENRWDEIEFDKLPSKAGMIYRNAFARRDILKEKYEVFAKSTETKVNASTLYPCDVVSQAIQYIWRNESWGRCKVDLENVDRLMINKYWDNLADYFKNAEFNGIAVVDTSGSMCGMPINVAIALGLYCAEKCNPKSPFYNHYITFSRNARLVETKGADFVDKVKRIYQENICENTNIDSVFDLLAATIVKNKVKEEDVPKNIIIISDMEFDTANGYYSYYGSSNWNYQSVIEENIQRFEEYTGYKAPRLIFWNVNARNDQIPMKDDGNVTFVSGYSPILFEQILQNKTGLDLVLSKLNSERYECIK